jgi:fluoride exporter
VWRALLVGLGGFIGSVGRYWIGGWVQGVSGSTFPFGTLAINVGGSFLIGLIVTAAVERGMLHPDVRLALAVGVCGGFTTMSTFSFETVTLLQRGLVGLALGNVLLTLAICMAAVWAGMVLARVL